MGNSYLLNMHSPKTGHACLSPYDNLHIVRTVFLWRSYCPFSRRIFHQICVRATPTFQIWIQQNFACLVITIRRFSYCYDSLIRLIQGVACIAFFPFEYISKTFVRAAPPTFYMGILFSISNLNVWFFFCARIGTSL